MCKICDDAMASAPATSAGPTANAWARVDVAVRAWLSEHPELEFDGVLDECNAWADHMAISQ